MNQTPGSALKQHMYKLNSITGDDARNVLEFFQSNAPQENFTSKIIRAISRADPRNTYLLATQYPGLVTAAKLVQNHEDAFDVLRRIAQPETSAAAA